MQSFNLNLTTFYVLALEALVEPILDLADGAAQKRLHLAELGPL
jgi:hypothetical protein